MDYGNAKRSSMHLLDWVALLLRPKLQPEFPERDNKVYTKLKTKNWYTQIQCWSDTDTDSTNFKVKDPQKYFATRYSVLSDVTGGEATKEVKGRTTVNQQTLAHLWSCMLVISICVHFTVTTLCFSCDVIVNVQCFSPDVTVLLAGATHSRFYTCACCYM